MRFPMKRLCLIVLFASGQAMAQTLDNAMMPQGSRDAFFGLGLFSRPNPDTNGASTETLVYPLLQAQFSNGVFIVGTNTIGMHWSDQPGIEYGPVLHWQEGRSPGGRADLMGSDELKASANVGGFFNYDLAYDFRFTSELVSTTDAPGLLLNVGLRKNLPRPAAHHTLSVAAGATFADSAYAAHHYGVAGNAASGTAPRNYVPAAGLMSVHAEADWNWALSSSWLIFTGVSATRFAPTVANSPITGNSSAVVLGSGLVYRY